MMIFTPRYLSILVPPWGEKNGLAKKAPIRLHLGEKPASKKLGEGTGKGEGRVNCGKQSVFLGYQLIHVQYIASMSLVIHIIRCK